MGPKSNLFTKDIECNLIEMVKQRPLLWDTTLEEYRRTDLKRNHWDQIAQALGNNYTGDMVHKRFQSMESTFRANERKIKSSKARCSGKGADEIYKPKWEYYNLLLFLKKTCVQTDSNDNISSQDISISSYSKNAAVSPSENLQRMTYYDDNTLEYMVIPDDTLQNNCMNIQTTSSTITQAVSICDTVYSIPIPPSTVPTPTTSTELYKRRSSVDSPIYAKRGASHNLMREGLNTIKNISNDNQSSTMDRFDNFGAYIASKLRAMNNYEIQEYYEREILKVFVLPRSQ